MNLSIDMRQMDTKILNNTLTQLVDIRLIITLYSFYFSSPAYEWQGHNKPLHPVSLEVDEKKRLQVFDRSGPALRSLSLGNQNYLDVFLSSDRQRKALLLKVPKEYDLVSSLKWEGMVCTFKF